MIYEALKKAFPHAVMTEKEMGRHLINIPTPNSHCTEDLDLTFIPNLTTDAASQRVRQGWMLAEEKKKMWDNTIASRNEMSIMAVPEFLSCHHHKTRRVLKVINNHEQKVNENRVIA